MLIVNALPALSLFLSVTLPSTLRYPTFRKLSDYLIVVSMIHFIQAYEALMKAFVDHNKVIVVNTFILPGYTED